MAISATARLKRKKLVDVRMERFLKRRNKCSFTITIKGMIMGKYPGTVHGELIPVLLVFQLRFKRKKILRQLMPKM